MHTRRFVPTPTWTRVLRHGSDEVHLLLVATDEENVVGWCRVFPVDGGKGGEVGIGLLAPYRNQGLGTEMLRQAIAWAKDQRFDYLRLTTRADNHRAIHVFERCGFVPTGRHNGTWLEMRLDFKPYTAEGDT